MSRRHFINLFAWVSIWRIHTKKKTHTKWVTDSVNVWKRKREQYIYVIYELAYYPLKSAKMYTITKKNLDLRCFSHRFLIRTNTLHNMVLLSIAVEKSSLNFMNIWYWHELVCYFSALFATTCCEPTTHFEFCCCLFQRYHRFYFE